MNVPIACAITKRDRDALVETAQQPKELISVLPDLESAVEYAKERGFAPDDVSLYDCHSDGSLKYVDQKRYSKRPKIAVIVGVSDDKNIKAYGDYGPLEWLEKK